MSSTSLSVDPRILPLVRNLKEQNVKTKDKPFQKNSADISSDKTSDNSTKQKKIIESKNQVENEKNKTEEQSKRKKSINRINSKLNKLIKKNTNTKLTIDGSLETKTKSGALEVRRGSKQNTKINIISRTKEQSKTLIPKRNNFDFTSTQLGQRKFNNMKSKSKYIQNLLNDIAIKKYKNSCIDILKNDNVVKKMYEQCGFEKTNYSYECFIENNFFNKQLFMYKLEMLFLDDNNFSKKNFKEVFFKSEIIKYLNEYISEYIYQRQMNNLKDVFTECSEKIKNFDLFHD